MGCVGLEKNIQHKCNRRHAQTKFVPLERLELWTVQATEVGHDELLLMKN